jgi:hypothetical protein
MSTAGQPAKAATVASARGYREGSVLVDWLSSTGHKVIGHLYLITSSGFFLIAGLMAMIMRARLLGRDNHLMSGQQYNELFTMHGTITLILSATLLLVGFANAIMPLQSGAPDVAFPRLNLLSYYLFVLGGLILLASFLTPGGGGRVRLVRLLPADQRDLLTRRRRRHVDHGPRAVRAGHHLVRGQLHHHDLLHARARHDHVPDADRHWHGSELCGLLPQPDAV